MCREDEHSWLDSNNPSFLHQASNLRKQGLDIPGLPTTKRGLQYML